MLYFRFTFKNSSVSVGAPCADAMTREQAILELAEVADANGAWVALPTGYIAKDAIAMMDVVDK